MAGHQGVKKILPVAQRSSLDSSHIQQAVDILRAGDCVGMPTETVYGLAADALNPRAVARVFEIKKRPAFDPLIVHVTSDMDLSKYVKLNPIARRLIDHFWPGPLTILIEKTKIVSDLVTSGHPTVAIRCPAHPIAQQLLKAFGSPLVAPSANLFGQLSPTSAQAVKQGLGNEIKFVLDGGRSQVGLESTIVDSTHTYPTLPVLRLGGISPSRLSEQGFELSYPTPIIGQAPGTLKNHYAPKLPLYIWDKEANGRPATEEHKISISRYAWLGWQRHREAFGLSYILSESGDSYEAAHQVFALLREMSEQSVLGIIAELPPADNLGRAIQDRLRRGASGFVGQQQNEWWMLG